MKRTTMLLFASISALTLYAFEFAISHRATAAMDDSRNGVGATAAEAGSSAPSARSRWRDAYFPNVTLTTQNGASVRFYDDLIKDKIVVINLIYTHCKSMCPLETARLAQVQQRLGDRVGKDIFFYSISLDPENDTPEVLRDYAEKFDVGPGWLFLTGKKSDITLISEKLGLDGDPNPSLRDGHAPSVLIGNEATGQWIRSAALDDPRYLAVLIGQWMNSWATAKPAKSYAQAPAIHTPDRGEYLFRTRCADCHSMGANDKIGPGLANVAARRSRDWLIRWVSEPDKMLAEKDPIAIALYDQYKQVTMPNQHLDSEEVSALIGFLEGKELRPKGTEQVQASRPSLQ
jgi:protein SCO1/2